MSTEGRRTQGRLLCVGITTVDLVQIADGLPQPGEKASTQSSYIDVGGPAANAAITASVLGSNVSLLTVIGSGPLAHVARDSLTAHGVTTVEQASEVGLPLSSIWIDAISGERTVLAPSNRSARFGPLTASLVPPGTTAVLLDGHYADLALAVAREAHASGIPILLDCGRWRPVYADLLPLATDVIACATFRTPALSETGPEQAVAAMYQRWRPQLCAMTRGPKSILVATERGMAELAVEQVQPVDTLGAGDVLHGAYLHYRQTSGLANLEALAKAAALATESCRHLGARRAVSEAVE